MANGGMIGRRNVHGVDGTSGVWGLREVTGVLRRVPGIDAIGGAWSMREITDAVRAGAWPPDPYQANVVALMHMDGTDGSTAFTDVKGNTFTPAGNAQIDTSQSKFGGASGLFDGSGDYFTSGAITGMPLGTGDFTVEFFVRPAIVGSGLAGLLATPSPSGYVTGGLYIRRSGGTIQVLMNAVSTPVAQASAAWAANVWIHVAVTRESGSVRLFIDGVLQGSATTNTTDLTGTTVRFGFSTQDAGSYNGWADALRITKGVARYTANFTPPAAPFPNG